MTDNLPALLPHDLLARPSARAAPGGLALVLSGGGARGAYEAGIARYVLGELLPRLPPAARPRIFCGTSVGAINACALAAHANAPGNGARLLRQEWQGLRLSDVFRLGWGDMASLARWMFGAPSKDGMRSLLDAAPLAELVRRTIRWRALHQNVADGSVAGVCISATDVESGHSTLFVEAGQAESPPSPDGFVDWIPSRLTPQHALASAAIPILFPTVRVAGRVYSDGGLRQNTPLAPALRLGADRMLVVGLRAAPGRPSRTRQERDDQHKLSSPLFLFGKLLDALLLDRVENDLANLRRVNLALRALKPALAAAPMPIPVAQALEAAGGAGLREVASVLLRPSQDLGKLASDVLQAPDVRERLSGPAGYLLRKLSENAEATGEPSDVLSYLFFDGEYADELIALGERDARAREEELATFLGAAADAAES
ncbi:MAG: patatin-like phospholipase family protein [Myxococcales bacterium]